MKGMISPINATSQGPGFYRLMAKVGIILSSVFLLLALMFIGEVKELFWDRSLIMLYSVFIIHLSYKKGIRRKKIYQHSNFLFFLFITQLAFASWYNDFHSAYLILFGVSIQTISVAFKTVHQAALFLLYASAIMTLATLNCSALSQSNQLYLLIGTFTMLILMLTLVHLKSKFYLENRIKEELLRTIVSKTEDGIFLTDFEGFIYEANARALDMFGYSLKEITGKNFSEFRKYDLSDEEDSNGVRQLLRNKFWNSELELKTDTGKEFYAFVSITWIHRFGKEYLLYKVSDISQRKQNEAEIIEARDLAQAATAAKSEFLATMSHEIRTPMNGVLGMTNIMMQSSLDDDQRNYLSTIKKSGESLLELLNDILDFSKIESGKMQLEQRSFTLKELVFDVCNLLKSNAERKGLELKLNFETELPAQLIGDSTKIRQVLVNLVGNAIKFTQSGEVDFSIDETDDLKFIKFSVKDTGIGIQKEEINRLFQSFTQLDSSTTRKFGGTGLGLAICKSLVEMMGGQIWVESSFGKGSTFYFTIPRLVDESVVEESHVFIAEKNEIKIHENQALSSLRVLLAEDNLVNQQVGILILKSMGVIAEVAENGKEVQKALAKSDFDLILMDVHMPEMDGIETTRWIRSQDKYDAMEIIALTANAFDEDRERCISCGMNAFLTKPMNPEELLEVLLNCSRNNSELRA